MDADTVYYDHKELDRYGEGPWLSLKKFEK